MEAMKSICVWLFSFVKSLISSSFRLFSSWVPWLFYGQNSTRALCSLKRKTLILDLDETLVYSSTKEVGRFDFFIEVYLNYNSCLFYVQKRPHLHAFLNKVSMWYEIVIFTASVRQYANPLIDCLDPMRRINQRFFRESCVRDGHGRFIKDLTRIGMDLSQTIIIDNSPVAYSRNRDNALPISHFHGNPADRALLDLIPVLEGIRFAPDVRTILGQN
eukprot:TRINITY_DN6610_c0_g1_i1.p1 TRINITY_DN6610_c0_g1~~TRINITY_DN6610_c0_g1_i1.p1  ORF type:complete len:217 (+),score=14.00 TRINITY_DN6610_c0_g1_i1:179-829(+)